MSVSCVQFSIDKKSVSCVHFLSIEKYKSHVYIFLSIGKMPVSSIVVLCVLFTSCGSFDSVVSCSSLDLCVCVCVCCACCV